jgi:hypothetical protein
MEAGIDSGAFQACVDWVRKELWEWEASDELPSDFARRVVNGVVRLCDVKDLPLAIGNWAPKNVKPGEFLKAGAKRVHLELVGGTARTNGTN